MNRSAIPDLRDARQSQASPCRPDIRALLSAPSYRALPYPQKQFWSDFS